MRKILTLLLGIVSLVGVLALVPHTYAQGPVEIVDVDLYLWAEETSNSTFENVAYGTELHADATPLIGEGRFVGWVVDGVLSDEGADAHFTVTSGMTLSLIIAPANEYAAVFVDSNGHVIDVDFVDDETEVTAPVELPDKPGYTVADPAWDKPLGTIEADTFFKLQYLLDSTTEFDVTVNGGEPTAYLWNSLVTVTATNENFTAWLLDGQVVSFDESYSLTVLGDMALEEATDALDVDALVSLRDVTGIRTGYQSYLDRKSVV